MNKMTKNPPIETRYLSEIVKQNDYFQRSVNISLDKGLISALEGFYCPISYEQVLSRMASLISQTGQSAFTWTGSYGSGKSSLALFLQALVSSDNKLSQLAQSKISSDNLEHITEFFDNKNSDWHVINLVGQTNSPKQLFKEALFNDTDATAQDIFNKLSKMVDENKKLIIFLDEMGKTLEAANRSEQSDDDIFFLQQLAEFVNRSQGKIVFIGILHQSFIAYARQAKKQTYNEWQKIQGRFVDCAITLSVDEQLYLISQVIEIDDKNKYFHDSKLTFEQIINTLVNNIAKNRRTDIVKLSQVLQAVFPLHPLVAILLCQLSKKEFGQNQRSIFSFLMSAEPYGFNHYLKQTPLDQFCIYSPDMFWDYIDDNLGNMILASEYAKPWLLAQMAVARYHARNDALAIRLIKIISLLSLLSGDTGVHGDIAVLSASLELDSKKVHETLMELEASGIIFYSKFKQAYVLNEGSDFNLSKAIEERLSEIDNIPFEQLKQFDPIIAKRHYQSTGSLRWAEIKLIALNNADVETIINKLAHSTDTSCVGYLCVLLPTNEDEFVNTNKQLSKIAKSHPNLLITLVDKYAAIIDLLKDSLALKEILRTDRHLINDAIARQETETRLRDTEDRIYNYLQDLLSKSIWHHQSFTVPKPLSGFSLSGLVSDIADNQVPQAVICNNELVNRNAPSPNAKGAIRELVKRMIENSKEPRLGIDKYPPERAIYESILKNNDIHQSDDGENFYFASPNKDSSLYHVWQSTNDFINQKQGALITADEIYQLWKSPPFGIKSGLCDILYIAYIISRSNDLANYIEEEYKPNLQYLLAEYLLKSPKSVGIREVASLKNQQSWIYQLRQKLQTEFCSLITNPIGNEPLPIAQALISVFDKLPSWLHRTNELEPNTKQLRNILKQSNDPNKLLFDDLPRFFDAQDDDESKADKIINALQEMHQKYPDLVDIINKQLFVNLKLAQRNDNINPRDSNLFDIVNNRANAIWKKTGDPTLEPFITRLRNYRGTPSEAEGLVSILANNKPSKNWIDQDIYKALQQLNTLSFNFLEAEINTNTPVSENRYKVSVILKSPNDIDDFEIQSGDGIKRNAHAVPQNLEAIEQVVQQMSSLNDFKILDSNDKVIALAKLFEQLAYEK